MSELDSTQERDRPADEPDGRHDFDFLFGRWTVANRKLRAPLDPDSGDWDEFASYVETQPVLGGLGNIDRYMAPEFPGRPGFEALALRLFDPGLASWRIWWASTATSGALDTPVLGRFEDDGRGVFECDDVLEGRPLSVRYAWSAVASRAPHWEQSFSFDGGASWHLNWTMVWRRAPDR
jgi:hypothetical protein